MAVAPAIVFADVDGDTVLLDGQSGVYYGLNQTGSRLWPLIVEGAEFGRLCDTLVAEYDVREDVARADLTRLITELANNALILVEPIP